MSVVRSQLKAMAASHAMTPQEVLIKDHMSLVYSMAEKYVRRMRGVFDFVDLVSEGMVTLWKCTKKWRDGEGVTFGLYASNAIVNTYGQLLIVVRRLKRQATLISMSLVDDEDEEGDWLFQSTERDPLSQLEDRQLTEFLNGAVSQLPANQREVIRLRFSESLTLQSVGEQLGFTKEYARQREASALKRLKPKALSAGYSLP